MTGRTGRRVMALATAAALAVGLAGAAPTLPAAAAPAQRAAPRALGPPADKTVTLPFEWAQGLVVDPTSGRIFAAGDDKVTVLTPAGAIVTTLTDLPGASAPTFGGGAVWVLLAGASSIARIDPASLAVTTWSLEADGPLAGLAYAGGRLWTVGAPELVDRPLLGLDPATGTRTRTTTRSTDLGMLASSPTDPSVLVGGDVDSSGHGLWRWDVSTGIPVEEASGGGGGFLSDLEVSPDGTLVYSTSGGQKALLVSSLATMDAAGPPYAMANHPAGVASTAANGGIIAAMAYTPYGPIDTWVYRPGGSAPLATAFMVNGTNQNNKAAAQGAIELSADGGTVLALSLDPFADFEDTYLSHAHLHLLSIAPTVTSVVPSVVGTRHRTSVAVTGARLGETTGARLGPTVVAISGISASSVTVAAPVLPAGSHPLSLDGPGLAATAPFRVAALGPFATGRRFVDRQYADVLGRAPTAPEQTTWEGRLLAGTDPGALPAGLVTTPSLTRYRAPVVRLLWAAGLSPTPARVASWSDRYRTGMPLASVGAFFAAAGPARPVTNFVDDAYRAVLGRPATPSELGSGRTRVQATSRGQLLADLSQSAAAVARNASQVRATEVYLGLYRRAPSANESRTAETTAALADRLLATPAYTANRYPQG